MDKLNPSIVALSLGTTSAILYVICLLIVAVMPLNRMTPFINNLQHSIDFTGIMAKNITLAGSIVGIVGWFLIAAATGYIFSFVYNSVAKKF